MLSLGHQLCGSISATPGVQGSKTGADRIPLSYLQLFVRLALLLALSCYRPLQQHHDLRCRGTSLGIYYLHIFVQLDIFLDMCTDSLALPRPSEIGLPCMPAANCRIASHAEICR
jgi:hypothetical protein